MSSTININSFFMPHVLNHITKEFIANTFRNLDICVIERIEWKPLNDYYSCFVFVNEWFNSAASVNFRDRLVNTKKNRIIYSDPWYWNICLNTSEISNYPMPKHMDLEFITHADTSINTIEMVFNALDLGKIHSIEIITGITSGLPLKKGRDYTVQSDTITIPWFVDENCWRSLVVFNQVLVKVHYEYWYRTLTAVKSQSSLVGWFNPGDERFDNLHLTVPVYNGLIWKVFESSSAPLTSGVNPFIWVDCVVALTNALNNDARLDFERRRSEANEDCGEAHINVVTPENRWAEYPGGVYPGSDYGDEDRDEGGDYEGVYPGNDYGDENRKEGDYGDEDRDEGYDDYLNELLNDERDREEYDRESRLSHPEDFHPC